MQMAVPKPGIKVKRTVRTDVTSMKSSTAKPAARRAVREKTGAVTLLYLPSEGVLAFSDKILHASPLELVEVERAGVRSRLLKDLAHEMDLPASRLYQVLGVPKATAEKKAATNEMISGAGGQAALGMVKLLAIAESIVANSTAESAKGFNTAKWLGQWIERPQPSLGGKKPAEILDTPTGVEVVSRLLGATESGAYQ